MIEIRGADKVDALINKEFGGDFELMASHLKIMNKRMVLLNPVSGPSFSLPSSFIEVPQETTAAALVIAIRLRRKCKSNLEFKCGTQNGRVSAAVAEQLISATNGIVDD